MEQEISSLRLPDAAFWGSEEGDHSRDPIVQKFKTSHFGVIIDGPREVAIQNRKTLPIFSYYMGSYKQTATRSFPRTAAVVAMRPEENEIYASSFIKQSGESLRTGKTTPAHQLPDGYLMTFQSLDLRARVELPWQQGRVLTQVLLMDLSSNRLETRFLSGAADFVDDEKEKFLAAERAKKDPPGPYPIVKPGEELTAADAPSIPETVGLILSAPRLAVLEGENPRLFLSGAWRQPLIQSETVKPDHAEYNKANGLLQPENNAPYAACVAIHLVVLASGEDSPTVYTLRFPVAKLSEENGKKMTSGQFTVDLLQLPDLPAGDTTLFLYAYAQESAAAPVTVGLIDRRAE